jgi:hypothetical protein
VKYKIHCHPIARLREAENTFLVYNQNHCFGPLGLYIPTALDFWGQEQPVCGLQLHPNGHHPCLLQVHSFHNLRSWSIPPFLRSKAAATYSWLQSKINKTGLFSTHPAPRSSAGSFSQNASSGLDMGLEQQVLWIQSDPRMTARVCEDCEDCECSVLCMQVE